MARPSSSDTRPPMMRLPTIATAMVNGLRPVGSWARRPTHSLSQTANMAHTSSSAGRSRIEWRGRPMPRPISMAARGKRNGCSRNRRTIRSATGRSASGSVSRPLTCKSFGSTSPLLGVHVRIKLSRGRSPVAIRGDEPPIHRSMDGPAGW